MAYKSSRKHNDDAKENSQENFSALDSASQKKKEREQSSQKALKTAAKGAGAYFGGPLGAKAVDMAANTKAGQKILNQGAKVLNKMPGVGRTAEKLDKSGAINAADKGIDLASGGGKGVPSGGVKAVGGGQQGGSLPSSHSTPDSSSETTSSNGSKIAGLSPFGKGPSFLDEDKQDNDDGNKKGLGKLAISLPVKLAIVTLAPIFLIILLLFIVVASVSGLFSDYEDAFGISQVTGEDTGGLIFESPSKEQTAFYNSVNNVKMIYQAMGKTVDPLKVVAIFHVLNSHGADLEYKDMNQIIIMKFADTMFEGNSYNEEVFRNNLINSLIPEYLPKSPEGERKQMADEVFDYIDRYYNLIGKDTSSTCVDAGSCSYDIKGFYIHGKGEISENLSLSNIYVRLMQCGGRYGGVAGQPLEGEELVPLEKYVLGVAYQEIGPSAPAEAVKAQLVAARSFILARHADMGGWHTLKQEADGKWVIQAAACTADQVYCDPDQGCSSFDGQWGQVYSGMGHGPQLKPPMAADHPLRQYANETAGEVLVNSNGYIIYAGYKSTETNLFSSLARNNLNYKQILLQVYNQNHNYGASDILKGNCNNGSSASCGTSSVFANWKQTDPQWGGVQMGNSGKTINDIGCLVTSVSMLIAKSGVQTNITNFNPGTFVEYLNSNGGFYSGGNFIWASATMAAPSFVYQGKVELSGLSKEEKLERIKELVSQKGIYVVAEVKGNTGQHWVAIDSLSGNTVNMMDPGSNATDLWGEYDWRNTSQLSYYRVS